MGKEGVLVVTPERKCLREVTPNCTTGIGVADVVDVPENKAFDL